MLSTIYKKVYYQIIYTLYFFLSNQDIPALKYRWFPFKSIFQLYIVIKEASINRYKFTCHSKLYSSLWSNLNLVNFICLCSETIFKEQNGLI